MNYRRRRSRNPWLAAMVFVLCGFATTSLAVPLPGNPDLTKALDPLTIPKYVQPLVIPPVMPQTSVGMQPAAGTAGGTVPAAKYNIAVRQFSQQILPGGIWNTVNGRTDAFDATPIWSYGPAEADAAVVAAYTAPAPLPVGGAINEAYFNYPAFTLEEISGVESTVRWINDLKDPETGNFLPHLLTGTVDQTLHWANPTNTGCINGTNSTDCATANPAPYTGPVPIVTHVHGAHVNAESDGYPEAWWLPAANNIPASYKTTGTLYTQNNAGQVQDYLNPVDFDAVDGAAFYTYENTQPATTLWYHDHSLGMTRLNVYAGPAGFYLIRGAADGSGNDGGVDLMSQAPAVLPGPAPVGAGDPNFDADYRMTIREIPIAIQDRSFNKDGTLFYPDNRAFFDTFPGPYIGDAAGQNSDIAPIWNPEAFFNTMVVNGTTWPQLDVAPARYRFRLLSGSNSRFLNLAMFEVTGPGIDGKMGTADDILGAELPFYQIGGDQGFLPNVVEVRTGFITPQNTKKVFEIGREFQKQLAEINKEIAKKEAKLVGVTKPSKIAEILKEIAKLQAKLVKKTLKYEQKLANNAFGNPVAAPDPMQALLMAPAERADVIVDFSGLPEGTIVRMINTADDAPFGGFAGAGVADPDTSGQVMQFVVNNLMTVTADATTTSPLALVPNAEIYDPASYVDYNTGATVTTTVVATPRRLSLNEEESLLVCVDIDGATGDLFTVGTLPPGSADPAADCMALDPNFPLAFPQAPKAALMGTVDSVTNLPVPLTWSAAITENPALDSSEFWDFYNFTVDGHPVHMHLVRYKIIHRQAFDPLSPTLATIGPPIPALPTETGMKDTVLAYPGEITRVQTTFNLPGLYVWHCHIVEHEDNEMMRPYYVGTKPDGFPVK